MRKNIRWQQRFANFQKALVHLQEAVSMDTYSNLEREGLVQRFEYTIELSWKTLQDLLDAKGYEQIKGPRPVIRQAFKDGYIRDGEGWMDMWDGRLLASHTYDEAVAAGLAEKIRAKFFYLLTDLRERLNEEITG